MTTELVPLWPGQDVAYSRAYTILRKLGEQGHATPAVGYYNRRGKWVQTQQGTVSETMRNAITALNEGNEEEIKAFNLKHINLWSEAHE